MSVKHPYIKWADRKDAVFIKIDVQDSQNTEVKITKQTVKYSGVNKKGYVVSKTFSNANSQPTQ